MNRLYFTTAYLLGAFTIGWMGSEFVGLNALALITTVVIAAVYTLGFFELHHFRQATATLSQALESTPAQVNCLDDWLGTLHLSLQNPVRLRIEGERVGLPGPVLTPYLVGLLVMLGLLGTFLGMIDTLKGAVVALEGTTELAAIRAGLVNPINGLGFAFGTSVAGVAASAMLGLVSAMSRRERVLASRLLDTSIAKVFRPYSLTHNRQETFKAMQSQAELLPEVAASLQLLANQLERMSKDVSGTLTTQQDKFHEFVAGSYSELASSVDQSLKTALSESARLAGDSIKPIIEAAMLEFNSETQKTHQHLSSTAQAQLESLSSRFADTSEQVNAAWTAGLSSHEQSNKALVDRMGESFETFRQQFQDTTAAMLESIHETAKAGLESQSNADQERFSVWAAAMEKTQKQTVEELQATSNIFSQEVRTISESQKTSIQTITQEFASSSATAASRWQQAADHAVSQQENLSNSLQETAGNISDNAQMSTDRLLGEMHKLLASSDELIRTRTESEAAWINLHEDRMASLATTISDNAQMSSDKLLSNMHKLLTSSEDLIKARTESEEKWVNLHENRMASLAATIKFELSSLRDDEQQRGEAAVEQLGGLESSVASHLASLGKELEEPMSRLIDTASQAPKAAAEVISQLREEISKNIERDNTMLEERLSIMNDLKSLTNAVEKNSTYQGQAIEKLVQSSASTLAEISVRFKDQVGAETEKISAIADVFAGSTIEISSLGETFSQAITLFNESNSFLVENLNRIEDSLDKSTLRSDEQLGYYVAQAREIIDHSLMSQKELFDEFRQLSPADKLVAEEVS